MTLENLAQELASLQLQALPRLQKLEQEAAKITALDKTLASLMDRVKVLEDARQAQISLNQTFARKSELYQPPVNAKATKPWKFW